MRIGTCGRCRIRDPPGSLEPAESLPLAYVRLCSPPAEICLMSTMPHGSVARVACFTEHACLVGDVAPTTHGTPRRVLDLLNDPTTSSISLIEPILVRPERLDTPLGTFASGRVRKSDLLCVALIDEPERPATRRLSSYVAKSPAEVVLLLRSLALVGTVHVNMRVDLFDLILAWPEPFLSLTEAGLIPDGAPVPDEAPPEPMTIFVNRGHILGVLSAGDAAAAAGVPTPAAALGSRLRTA